MTRQITIFEVVVQTTMIRHYYFSRLSDARTFAAKEEQDFETEFFSVEINPIVVKMSREGIASLLNHVIDFLCANDG